MMIQTLGATLAAAATLGSAIAHSDEDARTIRDLSPVVRIDLSSRQAAAAPGESIALLAVLTNVSPDPVALVPMQVFGYVNYSIEPRCAGMFGPTGQTVSEGRVGPVERDAVVLKPGKSVSRTGSFVAREFSDCSSGGTYLISVEYCQFLSATVDGLALLEGCVNSNVIVVALKPNTRKESGR
jgi:hypothetical protein